MTEEQRQAIEIVAHYLMENPDDVIFSDYDYGIDAQQAAEELFRLAGYDVADYEFSCSISSEMKQLSLLLLRENFHASGAQSMNNSSPTTQTAKPKSEIP